MQSELLREDWEAELATLFQGASERVLISSPFVTRSGVEFLFEHLPSEVREKGRIQVLANLSPENIVQGATEPESLQQLNSLVADTTLHHLPGLHAKVYVADTTEAIVTSGNLTAGGLAENYEYGIATRDEEAISVIRKDLEEYAGLGGAGDEGGTGRICGSGSGSAGETLGAAEITGGGRAKEF